MQSKTKPLTDPVGLGIQHNTYGLNMGEKWGEMLDYWSVEENKHSSTTKNGW